MKTFGCHSRAKMVIMLFTNKKIALTRKSALKQRHCFKIMEKNLHYSKGTPLCVLVSFSIKKPLTLLTTVSIVKSLLIYSH